MCGKTENDNSKPINKQKSRHSFSVVRLASEEEEIDHVSNTYLKKYGYWYSEFCNDIVIAVNVNKIQPKQQ